MFPSVALRLKMFMPCEETILWFGDSSVVMPQALQICRLEKIAAQLLTHCLYLSAMVNHDDVAGLKDIFLDVISS